MNLAFVEQAGQDRSLSLGRLFLEKVPLFALSVASAFITMVAQRSGGAVRTITEYPPGMRIENAIGAYFDYVGRMLWPLRLSAMYPHPGNSLLAWQVAAAALFGMAV